MGELGCNKVWEPRAITELYCLLGTVHRAPLTQISLYALTIICLQSVTLVSWAPPGLDVHMSRAHSWNAHLLFNKGGPNIFEPVQSFMHEAYA